MNFYGASNLFEVNFFALNTLQFRHVSNFDHVYISIFFSVFLVPLSWAKTHVFLLKIQTTCLVTHCKRALKKSHFSKYKGDAHDHVATGQLQLQKATGAFAMLPLEG